MKRSALVAVGLLSMSVGAGAADYFFPHFTPFKDDMPIPMPRACQRVGGLLGPAQSSLDDDGVMVLTYTCADGSVVLRTDMRPGSGTAVGGTSPNIHLGLDALNGGWAYECGSTIVGVSVTLNGQTQDFGANFSQGSRQDVAAAFGNTCAEMGSSGIGFYPDTSALVPGTYPMTMQVTDNVGKRSPVSNTVMVTVR